MRLDKYLKVSRLIKRRTVANNACDTGRIFVNGKSAKASYDVKIGDRISIISDTAEINVLVVSVNDVIKKEDASSMYKVI